MSVQGKTSRGRKGRQEAKVGYTERKSDLFKETIQKSYQDNHYFKGGKNKQTFTGMKRE